MDVDVQYSEGREIIVGESLIYYVHNNMLIGRAVWLGVIRELYRKACLSKRWEHHTVLRSLQYEENPNEDLSLSLV